MSKSKNTRRYLVGAITALTSIVTLAINPLPVQAATLTMSGTVTAGGTAVPKGTVQVAFLQYTHATCGAQPNGNIVVAMIGSNGTFSQELEMTGFSYRVIFRPMATAPKSSLWRLFDATSISGTTSFAAATCLSSAGGARSDVNLSTSIEGVSISGSLTTSTGQPVTSLATIFLSKRVESYALYGEGYAVRTGQSGVWDVTGIDKNQANLWMQVAVGGALYSVRKDGDSYSVISYDATCGAPCKFPIGSSDIANIDLRLPVSGTITGTVSGPNGAVNSAQVCAIAFRNGGTAQNMYSMEAGRSCTNSSGEYLLGLPYGAYRLQFQNTNGSPFKSEWFDNVSNLSGYVGATVITLAAGATASRTINPVLDEGKYIKGTVTNADNQPIANASVSAMLINSETSMYMGVGGVNTLGDGSFTLSGLEPGTYALFSSHPDYGQLYLGGTRETATTFTIGSSSPGVTGKDIVFPQGYSMSGTLSTGDGSEARICASAYLQTDSNMGWGNFVGSNCFTAPGPWQLKGLKSGSYRIRFDAQSGNLRSVFLGGTADFNSATVTEITTRNISNVDVTIPAGKSISGKIVDTAPAAVVNACINAYKQNGEAWGYGQWAGATCTSTTGEFSLRGLEDGSYKLRIEAPMNSDYSPGWISDGGTTVRAIEEAQLLSVTAGSISGLSQTLMTGPKFIATVLNGSTPVANVCLNAFKTIINSGWGEWGGNSCSGSDGKISIRGVTSGDYTFEVRPNSGDFQNGWYVQGSTTSQIRASATSKTIGSDSIDLGNILLVAGKKATGRIVNADGNPVSGVCIGALKVSTYGWGEWAGSTCTQLDGKFFLRGLDPSSSYRFRVDVWSGDYKPGFIFGQTIVSSYESASQVSASSDITIGDVVLRTGPSVSGTVLSGTEGESNVCVAAHDAITLAWKSSTCSQSNGKFVLRGLETGSYKLSWWSQKPLLVNGWYKSTVSGATQVSSPDAADTVELGSSGLSNLNIRLANGGKIYGSVTGSSSADLCVAAWLNPSSGTRENASAISCLNSEKKFELKGLVPSTNYYLQVFSKTGTSVTQSSPSVDNPYQTAGSAVAIVVS